MITIINIWNLIVNGYKFVKKHIKYFLVGLIVLLGGIIFLQKNIIADKDSQIGSLNNNIVEYSSTVNGLSTEKRVLQLKVSDLRNSHDKDIQKIDSLLKVKHIKPNTVHTVATIDTSIHDTLTTVLPKDTTTCDFDKTIQYNAETKFQVSRKEDTLKVIPTITNSSQLFIITAKVYRNKRANWFSRLIHWDWKKDQVKKYELVNSNDIFDTTKIKVIEIEN